MDGPPITPEQIAALPPEFQAILRAVIDYYEKRIADLEAKLAAKATPRNSSKPPSTEHPHAKPSANTPPSQRKPGGQPGHDKHQRALIPVEHCTRVLDHKPSHCRGCGERLCGADSQPLRQQVWEVPPIVPDVTEHRRHRLTCQHCGTSTCGELPAGTPTCHAGPRLVALTSLLMGNDRLSKRKVAAFHQDVLNIPSSPGWVVKLQTLATAALRPAYDELVQRLPDQGTLNIDESPTKQAKTKAWLWSFVARTFTVFALRLSRKADPLHELLGPAFRGIVGCDRAKMYFSMDRVQWCWAHRIRDCQRWIDSNDGQAKRLGRDLMRPVGVVFEWWWKVRDGTMSRRAFQARLKPQRDQIESLLLRGVDSGCALVRGTCDELWRHRQQLWMFVEHEDVEPTNNAAERALRQAVIWRKLSFGTQSDSGSRFVETILTVIETCRQQKRNVMAFVTQAITANFSGKQTPILAGV